MEKITIEELQEKFPGFIDSYIKRFNEDQQQLEEECQTIITLETIETNSGEPGIEFYTHKFNGTDYIVDMVVLDRGRFCEPILTYDIQESKFTNIQYSDDWEFFDSIWDSLSQ